MYLFVRWKKIIILAARFWWQSYTFRMAKPLELVQFSITTGLQTLFEGKGRKERIPHYTTLFSYWKFAILFSPFPQPHLDSDCGFFQYSFEPCLAGNAVAQFSLTTLFENWPKACRPSAARAQALTQRRQDQTPWNIVNLYHEAPCWICRVAS